MEKQQLTQAEQAMLLWPMLLLAARNQEILSYARVASLTGIAQQGLGQPLGLIHDYCKRKHLPYLNCLVVSRETGLPGEAFPEDWEPARVLVEQSKVFVFDWAGNEKPRPHDFE